MDLNPRTKTQLQLLCEERNRAIWERLNEQSEPTDVATLAEHLVARETTLLDDAAYKKKCERLQVELHHNRLPKLANAGLLRYDSETNEVSAVPSPASTVDWYETTELEAVLDSLERTRERGDGEIGVVEGRDAVFRYGRKLTSEATEELFAIYATTELLEDECVNYGEAVLARGARLVIGSQNEEVRRRTQETMPGATVWEPQYDWLNTHAYPRVGRLILADRENVMFSIIDEKPADGEFPPENALVGTGKENPLVVLVRELLGERLDHLDYQSDEFRNNIHSQL